MNLPAGRQVMSYEFLDGGESKVSEKVK